MFILMANIVWLCIMYAAIYQIRHFPMLDAHPAIRREVAVSLVRQTVTWAIVLNLWICGG